MKVWIAGGCSSPIDKGGKGLFTCRLGQALRDVGVDVTENPDERSDIALHVVRMRALVNARRHVVRIDGIYHNTAQDWKKKNAGIEKSIRQADGVVFQSKHSERLCQVFFGYAGKQSRIIRNGSLRAFYNLSDTANDVSQSRVVMIHGKFRGHKRLGPMIESFLTADMPDSILLIAGNLSKCCIDKITLSGYLGHPKVRNLGVLNQSQLAMYLKRSDAAMHLCWLDACPNSVVEALCAGVPVLTNNVGGSHELLESCNLNQLICNIDQPWDYEPCDLYDPPLIDVNVVAEKLQQCFINPPYIGSTHVSIEYAAINYWRFFSELLSDV